MTTLSHRTATDLGIRGAVQKLVDAVTDKVRETLARMKARHDCRQMLDCEEQVLPTSVSPTPTSAAPTTSAVPGADLSRRPQDPANMA